MSIFCLILKFSPSPPPKKKKEGKKKENNVILKAKQYFIEPNSSYHLMKLILLCEKIHVFLQRNISDSRDLSIQTFLFFDHIVSGKWTIMQHSYFKSSAQRTN